MYEIERGSWDSDEVKMTFSSWLADVQQKSDFDLQNFSRTELSRWLIAIGMKSVYQFDRSQIESRQAPSGRWPWGDHHTELLRYQPRVC